MSGHDVLNWVFGALSLALNLYIGRAIYRRNLISAYLFGLFLLTVSAIATGMMAGPDRTPIWFLLFLVLAVLFMLLILWRVRVTGRVIRGRLAFIVWLAGGVALHLVGLYRQLRWDYLLNGFPSLPSWLPGCCAGVLMLGMILATLQLRDAEWYFT